MAVTVTYDALVSMLYHGPGTEDRPALVANIYNAAVQAVSDYAPAAPDAIADRAVVMLAGYLDDAPFGPRKMGPAGRGSDDLGHRPNYQRATEQRRRGAADAVQAETRKMKLWPFGRTEKRAATGRRLAGWGRLHRCGGPGPS